MLLVRPPFGVSTAQAYGWFDETSNAERRTPNTEPRKPDPGIATSIADIAGCPRVEGRVSATTWKGLWPHGIQESAYRRAAARRGRNACGHVGKRVGVLRPVRAGGQAAGHRASGWPGGTRVWHTRLLSRAEYAELPSGGPASFVGERDARGRRVSRSGRDLDVELVQLRAVVYAIGLRTSGDVSPGAFTRIRCGRRAGRRAGPGVRRHRS